MKDKLQKAEDYKYILPREGNMRVHAEIFMNDALIQSLEEEAVIQIANVATLPGIVAKSLAMPDAHTGYGFSIGGVAAIDKEYGCISPGGIGFDINCGVRMLCSNLGRNEIEPVIRNVIQAIFARIPCGLGGENQGRLDTAELDDVLKKGAGWAVKNGYGCEEDLLRCEEEGCMHSAEPSFVTSSAKARGRKQLGTLGAGNHFLEIQYVDKIFDSGVAKAFGIEREGQVCVMIHCGSRGLGHQVCADYLKNMEEAFPEIRESIPSKNLIYAPAKSKIARKYFGAMSASANFAWANRHIIAHHVRQAISDILKGAKLGTLYDVAHNIAKDEEYEVDKKNWKCWVHRKGATRALGPGNPLIPSAYRDVGQPIILPGSMGTSSYVLVGTKKAELETFASTAHGAGRVMSRKAAKKAFNPSSVRNELLQEHIHVKSASKYGISEEAPAAYKDVDEVVKVSHAAGIGNLVARLRPLGVIKG